MKKLIALITLWSTCASAGLPPTSTQGQYDTSAATTFNFQFPHNSRTSLGGVKSLLETGSTNLLTNGSFENATFNSSWTTGGSGLAATQDTSNVHDGKASALLTFTSSTTGTFYQSFTPTEQYSNNNMMSAIWVKTTLSTLQVCAWNGTTASNCQAVPATGAWTAVPVNFIGPSSGPIGIIVETNGTSTTGTANVDQAYVGLATNLSQVSQSVSLGTATWVEGTNGWSISSASTTYSAFPANSSISAPTFSSGSVLTAPATRIPAVVIPSAGPGTYYVVGNGHFESANGSSSWLYYTFSDGTNLGPDNGQHSSTSATAIGSISSTFTYTTTQTNLTFQVEARSYPSAGTAYIGASNTSTDSFAISVFYYPSQQATTYNSSNLPANWSGTSTLSGTTSGGSFADLGSITGAITTSASRNMTCVAATGQVGITCTMPRAGNYGVCYSGYMSNSGSYANEVELTDGSNNVVVGLQYVGASASAAGSSIGGCNNYAAVAGNNTFKLRGLVSNGTGSFYPTSFSISDLDAPQGAPIFVQNTQPYYSGYMPGATSWTTSSSTFADPSVTGSNTLTAHGSPTLSVTAAASNLPGIVIPAGSSSSVYMITASFAWYSSVVATEIAAQLTDGTNQITTATHQSSTNAANSIPTVTMTGFYAPGNTSANTVKIQLKVSSGGTAYIIDDFSLAHSIEWSVLQIH